MACLIARLIVSGHRFRVQGFTIILNVDSIVLVIEDCNLRFICFLEFVIWDFKDTPKPPPAANRSRVLQEMILYFVHACLFDIVYYHKFMFGEIFRNVKGTRYPCWMIYKLVRFGVNSESQKTSIFSVGFRNSETLNLTNIA